MDSTLLDSNLATCSRLQLVISCLQVFWKSLDDEQKARLGVDEQQGEADRVLLNDLCTKRPSQWIYAMDSSTKQSQLEGELTAS